mmetsp:Transcript_29121/g.89199  ORF Transcript_29121/g.89199 Transcript_29121/m.89199 type:complete len:200 (+) Transcript_29121:1231-1830(+)|eukprot:scaffold170820_cov31-Tisochrysis_lutea.AAC.3
MIICITFAASSDTTRCGRGAALASTEASARCASAVRFCPRRLRAKPTISHNRPSPRKYVASHEEPGSSDCISYAARTARTDVSPRSAKHSDRASGRPRPRRRPKTEHSSCSKASSGRLYGTGTPTTAALVASGVRFKSSMSSGPNVASTLVRSRGNLAEQAAPPSGAWGVSIFDNLEASLAPDRISRGEKLINRPESEV